MGGKAPSALPGSNRFFRISQHCCGLCLRVSLLPAIALSTSEKAAPCSCGITDLSFLFLTSEQPQYSMFQAHWVPHEYATFNIEYGDGTCVSTFFLFFFTARDGKLGMARSDQESCGRT